MDCNPDEDHVSSDNQGAAWFRADIAGIILSLCSLSFVSFAILSDRRVRTHPNKLIAYICLCDAYTYAQYLNRYIICGFRLNLGLERLFSWTAIQPFFYMAIQWFGAEYVTEAGEPVTWEFLLKYYSEHEYWYGAVSVRLQGWYLITIIVSYMSIFFSLSTVLDLYLMLKNPFSSSEKRIKKAMTGSIIAAVILAWIGLIFTRAKKYWLSELNYRLYQAIAFSNIFVASIVMVLVLIRFRKKGMNPSIKKQISQRYLEFVVLLAIFSWPICYLTKPSYRYDAEITPVPMYVGGTRYIHHWYTYLICTFGLLVALSRMRDKLLRVKVYNLWMTLTCRQRKKVKFDEFEKLVQQTALNTFLKTSLNTELVITILKGIVILAASSSDKIDHMDDSDMYRI